MNILIEATGGLTSGYLIKAIKDSGHRVIGSDIFEFNHSRYMCDDFVIMPNHFHCIIEIVGVESISTQNDIHNINRVDME